MNIYYKYTEQRVFFFGGKLIYFQKTLPGLFSQLPGLGKHFKQVFYDKYELPLSHQHTLTALSDFNLVYRREVLKSFNIFLSQTHSVNNSIFELQRLNIVRLYLARFYRGKFHALGKPTRGQRT